MFNQGFVQDSFLGMASAPKQLSCASAQAQQGDES